MNKLPDLNRWDKERLETSIKEIGIKLPIVFDQTGRVIDGHHRKEIAEKLGIDYPRQTITVKDDGEFDRLSIELNLVRRHLTQEQIHNWYEERKRIALEARQNGATQKEAAEAAGVARQTLSDWENNDKSGSNAGAGITSEPPDNRVKLDKLLYEEIWQRRQDGKSSKELAEVFGVTARTIRGIISQVTKQKNKEAEIEKAKEQAEINNNNDIDAKIYHGDMSDPKDNRI